MKCLSTTVEFALEAVLFANLDSGECTLKVWSVQIEAERYCGYIHTQVWLEKDYAAGACVRSGTVALSSTFNPQSSLEFVDLSTTYNHTGPPPQTSAFIIYDRLATVLSSLQLSSLSDTLELSMAARGPAGSRGGNSRFAQFKLVLLGMLNLECRLGWLKDLNANIDHRRICCGKGRNSCCPI